MKAVLLTIFFGFAVSIPESFAFKLGNGSCCNGTITSGQESCNNCASGCACKSAYRTSQVGVECLYGEKLASNDLKPLLLAQVLRERCTYTCCECGKAGAEPVPPSGLPSLPAQK